MVNLETLPPLIETKSENILNEWNGLKEEYSKEIPDQTFFVKVEMIPEMLSKLVKRQELLFEEILNDRYQSKSKLMNYGDFRDTFAPKIRDLLDEIEGSILPEGPLMTEKKEFSLSDEEVNILNDIALAKVYLLLTQRMACDAEVQIMIENLKIEGDNIFVPGGLIQKIDDVVLHYHDNTK